MAESTSPRTGDPEGAPGIRLPPRYRVEWVNHFESQFELLLTPGVRILDVGSGRKPTLEPDRRPQGCFYTGLDLSSKELLLAPSGSYDEVIEADVATLLPDLHERFDLILSWQVFEHVAPLDATLDNLRTYLRPGGRMVTMLSGGLSAFGLVNRAIPRRVGVWALDRLTGRDPGDGFSHSLRSLLLRRIERDAPRVVSSGGISTV